MGAAIDTGDKKSVNVHLNIVPFIDLMSCLTAFLLVTAVWSNLAQINIKPKGIARQADKPLEEEEEVRASILIQEDGILIGLSRVGDRVKILRDGKNELGDPKYEWDELTKTLERHKKDYFTNRQDIEIAAEDKIPYQTIITTMDKAIAAGFIDVGLAEPGSLSAQLSL